MKQTSSHLLTVSGRVLLALYFLIPGIAKLAAPSAQLALMQHHKIAYAAPLLYMAGFAQVIGALLLISNRHVQKTALGFVLYIVIINLVLHDFWNFSGVEAGHELQNFIKNLGILAGLLVLAGSSRRRAIKFKTLLRSDRPT